MNALAQTESWEKAQFVIACRELMRSKGNLEDYAAFADRQHAAGRVQSMTKAAVATQDLESAWLGADGKIISQAFMASLSDASILDAVMQYALPIPIETRRIVLMSGAVAGTAAEGAPKVATRVSLTVAPGDYLKAAAMIVMSDDLARSTEGAANKLLTIELRTAVVRAVNAAFLGALTMTAATAGATAAASLQAGLAAAANASAYVVAASPAQVRELALTRPNGSTMGVRGGEYIPGVTVIPANVTKLTVIPADRLGIADYGTTVANASHATVEQANPPTNPPTESTTVVSLWQNNLQALLVERRFQVTDGTAVEVA